MESSRSGITHRLRETEDALSKTLAALHSVQAEKRVDTETVRAAQVVLQREKDLQQEVTRAKETAADAAEDLARIRQQADARVAEFRANAARCEAERDAMHAHLDLAKHALTVSEAKESELRMQLEGAQQAESEKLASLEEVHVVFVLCRRFLTSVQTLKQVRIRCAEAERALQQSGNQLDIVTAELEASQADQAHLVAQNAALTQQLATLGTSHEALGKRFSDMSQLEAEMQAELGSERAARMEAEAETRRLEDELKKAGAAHVRTCDCTTGSISYSMETGTSGTTEQQATNAQGKVCGTKSSSGGAGRPCRLPHTNQ
jgi:chromosome segregation ATPase